MVKLFHFSQSCFFPIVSADTMAMATPSLARCPYVWMYGRTDVQTYGHTDVRTYGATMDIWMYGRTYGQNECLYVSFLHRRHGQET
jgi:hypothetical protein